MRETLLLGLTGGIGSGKSTVGTMLAQHGAQLIDADAISRSLTAAGGAAIETIKQKFGPQFINAEGALDREHMRQKVFAEPAARQLLESIIHPLVGSASQQQAQLAKKQGLRCVVLDIPLLVESGHWRQRLHRVVVVDCDEETQIHRVMARNALSRDAVQAILKTQASRTVRRAAADAVIVNDGSSLRDLEQDVSQLVDLYEL